MNAVPYRIISDNGEKTEIRYAHPRSIVGRALAAAHPSTRYYSGGLRYEKAQVPKENKT